VFDKIVESGNRPSVPEIAGSKNVGMGNVLILDTDVLTIIQGRRGIEYARLVQHPL
jgi:hypothetical protein